MTPDHEERVGRSEQLAYSEQQPLMLDERSRRTKAAKIISVLEHFLGREDLRGLEAVDIGCSTGFIAHEMYLAGATVTGVDIDLPGLERARERFSADRLSFLEYSGTSLPLADSSADIVVYNHVYEHTVDPDVVMSEIRRILKPAGVVYLGLGNRFGVMEPHYRLPFLSWLPRRLADRYVRATHRGDQYYERFKTRRGLSRMCAGLTVWEHTYSVLAEPEMFSADDMVSGPVRRLPPLVWRAMTPIIPTFIWIGSHGLEPRGAALRVPPERVATGAG